MIAAITVCLVGMAAIIFWLYEVLSVVVNEAMGDDDNDDDKGKSNLCKFKRICKTVTVIILLYYFCIP